MEFFCILLSNNNNIEISCLFLNWHKTSLPKQSWFSCFLVNSEKVISGSENKKKEKKQCWPLQILNATRRKISNWMNVLSVKSLLFSFFHSVSFSFSPLNIFLNHREEQKYALKIIHTSLWSFSTQVMDTFDVKLTVFQ